MFPTKIDIRQFVQNSPLRQNSLKLITGMSLCTMAAPLRVPRFSSWLLFCNSSGRQDHHIELRSNQILEPRWSAHARQTQPLCAMMMATSHVLFLSGCGGFSFASRNVWGPTSQTPLKVTLREGHFQVSEGGSLSSL